MSGPNSSMPARSSPPRRGCSARLGGEVRGWSPPRRRGGAPLNCTIAMGVGGSSPPTRGCSDDQSWLKSAHGVLPPTRGQERPPPCCAGSGPPRRRGGDPVEGILPFRAYGSSSPTRGAPSGCGGVGSFMVFTRRRGGVPFTVHKTTKGATSSPPTWGCSDPGRRPIRCLCVLPADAGVIRSSATNSATPSGPPRRRGVFRVAGDRLCLGSSSSPPTRECSVRRGLRPAPQCVFPVDAGVFRRAHDRVRHILSPPRQRGAFHARGRRFSPPRRCGGVPRGERTGTREVRSSPPTRECSGHRTLGARHHRVLPADPRRPPRQRGGVPGMTSSRAFKSASSPPTRG